MTKKIIIGFLLSLLVLIVSEYFFLQELYTQQRPAMIALTSAGLLAGAVLFLLVYRRFRKLSR